MLNALMAFLIANTGLPGAPLPVVERERLGGWFAYHEAGRVVLSREVDLSTTIGRSILVHELDHYLRFKAGLPVTEKTAYRAQIAYLRHVGDDPCNYDGRLAREARC